VHRLYENEPGTTPGCASNVLTMDQNDSAGDRELCFDNRATSVLAAFRPLGIWPSTSDTTVAIPAGSTVAVDLYTTVETPTAIRPTGVFMATDRVLGTGAATPQPVLASGANGILCAAMGEACWTKFSWSFQTTRHAIHGEQLTLQVQLIGTRSWAFGYEGAHASRVTITPAAVPAGQLDFGATFIEPAEGAKLSEDPFTAFGSVTFPNLGTTEAGDHPTTKRVDVSADDPAFASPIQANLTLDAQETSGSWSAPIPRLAPGAHTLYVRAAIDRNTSPVTQRTITVQDTKSTPRVQWQVTSSGTAPTEDCWQPANGLLSWQFAFDTRAYGTGDFVIHARLLEQGAQTAITSVPARFK